MDGWVKLHRELVDKPIWQCSTPEQKTILITILMLANHQEKEWEWNGKKFTCKAGQFITSLENLANKCGKGVSIQNVRTALDRFKKYEFLTYQSTKSGRLINVVNWGLYQSQEEMANKGTNKDLTNDQQTANKDLTNDQQTANKDLTTNKNERMKECKNYKNDKNDKNDKNEEEKKEKKKNTFSSTTYIRSRNFSEILEEKVIEWVSYKKERRETYKETGLKSLCTQIQNKANDYGEVAVCNLITECMANGWKGIIWDKLKNQQQQSSGNVFLDIAMEGGDVF